MSCFLQYPKPIWMEVIDRPHIEIPSSVEFIIVGPIGDDSGYLVKSKKLGTDIFGAAYMLYYDRMEWGDGWAEIANIDHLWAELLPTEETKEKTRLLFCWRGYATDREKRLIAEAFGAFLHKIGLTMNLLIESKALDITMEQFAIIIAWEMSPVLMHCSLVLRNRMVAIRQKTDRQKKDPERGNGKFKVFELPKEPQPVAEQAPNVDREGEETIKVTYYPGNGEIFKRIKNRQLRVALNLGFILVLMLVVTLVLVFVADWLFF